MTAVFVKVVSMSRSACWLILAVLLLRVCLKKAPRWIVCLLWALVGVRLVWPFSFRSVLSLLPVAEPRGALGVPHAVSQARAAEVAAAGGAADPALGGGILPGPILSIDPVRDLAVIESLIWAAGIVLMLLYAVVSYIRVYRSVQVSVPLEGDVCMCDNVRSPFILGVVRPRIFLPSGMDPAAMGPVIAHERAHLERRDHWWKPLGFLLLTVHWFDPLCWAAYVLLCRDIEFACDEKVVRSLDLAGRKEYSSALLECSVRGGTVTVCPLAFGEVGVKERVESVLRYKKPAALPVAAALAACAAVGVCFATDPVVVPGLKDISSAGILCQTGEFRQVSEEKTAELLELLRTSRCTSAIPTLDLRTGRPKRDGDVELVGPDGEVCLLRCDKDSNVVRLDSANGDVYMLVGIIYKGIEVPYVFDYRYRYVLTCIPASGGPMRAWNVGCDLDDPYLEWIQRY